MELFSQNTDFQFFGKSVQGASHKNKQKPNQDALSISFESILTLFLSRRYSPCGILLVCEQEIARIAAINMNILRK